MGYSPPAVNVVRLFTVQILWGVNKLIVTVSHASKEEAGLTMT